MSHPLAFLPLLLVTASSRPARPAPVLDERHVLTVDGTSVRCSGTLLDWTAE